MAKSAFAGEMRTKIRIQGQEAGINARGYPDTAWKDLFPGPVWCKWVNAHGREAFDLLRLELGETATLTLRYSPLVTIRCRVLREEDIQAIEAAPEAEREDLARRYAYEIVSLDNVEDKRQFLEIQIKRRRPA